MYYRSALVAIFLMALATASVAAQSATPKITESPCGVRYEDDGDLFDDDQEWRIAGIAKANAFFYNTRKSTCDSSRRVLKVWIKAVPRPVSTNSNYSVQRIEVNCRIDQTRVISFVDYDSNGEVIDSDEPDYDAKWEDVVPSSVMQSIVKTVCRK